MTENDKDNLIKSTKLVYSMRMAMLYGIAIFVILCTLGCLSIVWGGS